MSLFFSGIAALLSIAISGLALVGFAFDWEWAWRPIDSGRAIHPMGALCMLSIAVAAWLLRPGRKGWLSLSIATVVASVSLYLLILILTGNGRAIDAILPFDRVLAREMAAGTPISMRPLAAVSVFLFSTAIILRHLGRSSAAQLVVGAASIAPIGTLLGYAYGLSGSGTLMGPVGAVCSVLASIAIAGRTAHKVPLRSVLTINPPGRVIRIQMVILVGFSLVLSIAATQSRWEQNIRTFAVEVAVLVVVILLTLANAAYRWQQEQQRHKSLAAGRGHGLAADLDGAWDRGEMQLAYQPQVRLSDEMMVGVEALVRWQHPHRGPVGPDEFIPLAEATGLIDALGTWVFETACRQAARWQGTPLATIVVSINVSALQLNRDGAARRLIEIQRHAGVAADRIVVEVTESTLIQRGGRPVTALRELRDAGFVIAIDDFGTGYSSLASLQILPSQYLKIDRSFVSELPKSDVARKIVQAVVGMGVALEMKVIAEGVETPDQAIFLRTIGCEKAQGYFYGRPTSADDLELQAANRRTGH